MRISIAAKLAGGFAVAGVVIIGLVVFTYASLVDLRNLQDEGATRANDASEITWHAGMGSRVYQIIADAIINRDLSQTRADWDAIKAEMEEMMAYDQEVVDTDDERRWASEVRTTFATLVGTVENELLPLLETTDGMTPGLRELDGEIDQLVGVIQDRYLKIKDSIQDEMVEADEKFDTAGAETTMISMIVAIVAVIAIAVIAFALSRMIAAPIREMTGAMGRLADGDKEIEIPARNRNDEVGEMAAAVQVFKDNMIKADQLSAEQEEMKQRAEVEKRQTMNRMADEFAKSVCSIVTTVSSAATELQASANSLSGTAEETSRQSTAVSAASDQASANVQTVASSAEELSASVSEIGRQVSQATEIAGMAVDNANRTNAQIENLSLAAQKISQVVELISDIAEQTNLLALNATIEAARAGEAGRGFAVVAQEVKTLAGQTAKATDEIAQHVSEVQSEVSSSVDAIKSIGGTIERINDISTAIAAAIEQQSAATDEIARNVEQAATGTKGVSTNIQDVTRAAGGTSQSAGQVLDAASELSEQSERLRSEVEQFIEKVRAA